MIKLSLSLVKSTLSNNNISTYNYEYSNEDVYISDPTLEARLADGFRISDIKLSSDISLLNKTRQIYNSNS